MPERIRPQNGRVRLDHAATTPLSPAARQAWLEASGVDGNPSSVHASGRAARAILEDARERIAATLGVDAVEVVLTSGGTESLNLALKGLWWARAAGTRRILLPDGEHHATIDAVGWLEDREHAVVTRVPLDARGRLRPDAVREALGDGSDVALATMLAAGNETGTVQPVAAVAALCADRGVPLVVDAVAAYGRMPLDVGALRRAAGGGIAAVAVSAHKIGGPAGVGALVVSRDAAPVALVHGGGQQRGLRSGTEDHAAAAAFAAAAEDSVRRLAAERERQAGLAERLIAGVDALDAGVVVNSPRDVAERLPGIVHLAVPGAQGDSLMLLLDAAGIDVSTGSACRAGVTEPSHVLLAMGRSTADALGALRVSLGATSTEDDVDALLAALPDAIAAARRAGLVSLG